MDYLYDGSFEGLLCCIYAHYYEQKAEGIFRRGVYQQNMLRQFRLVITQADRATKVYEAIRDKISPETLRRAYAVYLSQGEGCEMKILRYVVLGFRVGSSINQLHSHPVVFEVQQAEKKVHAEKHRFLGLVRFSVISKGGEVLYARLEPDYDIVELMAPHFVDRYKNDPFILHDMRREKAVFAEGGHWYVAPLPRHVQEELAPGEETYRALWKKYFETAAIAERINPDCQKRCMPVRYWKNLTEI